MEILGRSFLAFAIFAGLAVAGRVAYAVCVGSDATAKDTRTGAVRTRRIVSAVAWGTIAAWGGTLAVLYVFSESSSSTDSVAVIILPLYSFLAAVGADAVVKAVQNWRCGTSK
jgi:hypothetical protein